MPNLLGLITNKDFLVPKNDSRKSDSHQDLDHIASALSTLAENSYKPGMPESEFKKTIDALSKKLQGIYLV